MAKPMPRNPRNPEPTFVTADSARGIAYGWRADKHGILAFGITRQQAIDLWRESYMAEYFAA